MPPRATNRRGFPDLGVGVGLRTVHFGHVLASHPLVDRSEVLSENFMDTGGQPLRALDQVADRYSVSLHGVSMSIGSTDPLNLAHLRRLKALANRTRAHWVSGHSLGPVPSAETPTTCCRCRTPKWRCITRWVVSSKCRSSWSARWIAALGGGWARQPRSTAGPSAHIGCHERRLHVVPPLRRAIGSNAGRST